MRMQILKMSTVQDLTFQREGGATHTIDGISTYLTRAAQKTFGTNNVHQYDSNKLEASDIVATSPWSNNETEFIQIKEGDKFVVTYDNLNQSSMREDTDMHPIKRVIYRYEILSLPSNDGKGLLKSVRTQRKPLLLVPQQTNTKLLKMLLQQTKTNVLLNL